MTETATVDCWAILEILGRQKHAGKLTTETIGGAVFFRIDTPPQNEEAEGTTRFFGAQSIYSWTPVTETVARMMAARLPSAPVTAWDLPHEIQEAIRQRRIAATPTTAEEYDTDDDYDPTAGGIPD